MEVKPGYKQTEVGVIPEEWEVRKLGERSAFRTGPFGSALHKSDYIDDGVPVINPMHIFDGQIVSTRTMTVTEAAAKHLADFRLKSGDIIMGRRGDMGRCAVVQSNQAGWLCGTGSIIIRCADSVAPNFLQRVLSSPRVVAAIEDTSVGSTMINLNQSTLAGLRIQFPPLPEQRTIAGALSDVDALIGALDRLITKKRDLKQAAMQQLLTPPGAGQAGQKRLPGFHGEWEVKRFADVAFPRRDRVDPRRTGVHEFCVELEHIESASGVLLGSTSTGDQSSLKSVFRTGDVLFGKLRAYLRKYWLATRSGVCSTEIWVFAPNDRLITTDYLFQFIKTDQFIEVASNAYGTHMPRSDWNVVKNYEMQLPSLPEQTAIAEVLSDMDAELAALTQRRDKTRALKQGMMQELLTGRIRLV